jgi:flavin-binding protein dodecin
VVPGKQLELTGATPAGWPEAAAEASDPKSVEAVRQRTVASLSMIVESTGSTPLRLIVSLPLRTS